MTDHPTDRPADPCPACGAPLRRRGHRVDCSACSWGTPVDPEPGGPEAQAWRPPVPHIGNFRPAPPPPPEKVAGKYTTGEGR